MGLRLDDLLFVISLILVSFGIPFYSPMMSIGASLFGYALFWMFLLRQSDNTKRRFWLSFWWFLLVQAVQLYWLTSSRYMGLGIYAFYLFCIAIFGLQYGCIAFCFKGSKWDKTSGKNPISGWSFSRCIAIAGFWTLMEWSRNFFFTTFSWNPCGLVLAQDLTVGFGSVFGVYGLSFWVILVNALFIYGLRSLKNFVFWGCIASFPYVFSIMQTKLQESLVKNDPSYLATIVQTAVMPEQKDFFSSLPESYIHPIDQWSRIFEKLKEVTKTQMIVLPESVVSFGARRPVYFLDEIEALWVSCYGETSLKDFPALKAPFATFVSSRDYSGWKVTNAFICQSLANHFHAKVIAGFDEQEREKKFNSGFCFYPDASQIERYDKRILVPVTETCEMFLISDLIRFIGNSYGMESFFDKGEKVKVFQSDISFGLSICVEEIYGQCIRLLRENGANLFINITNDVWFPDSKLPHHHFLHAKVRSAENGVSSIRSSNTGISGVIDCFGRNVETLCCSEKELSVLTCSVPLLHFKTLYSFWGDLAIVSISFLSVIFFRFNRRLVQ